MTPVARRVLTGQPNTRLAGSQPSGSKAFLVGLV